MARGEWKTFAEMAEEYGYSESERTNSSRIIPVFYVMKPLTPGMKNQHMIMTSINVLMPPLHTIVSFEVEAISGLRCAECVLSSVEVTSSAAIPIKQ